MAFINKIIVALVLGLGALVFGGDAATTTCEDCSYFQECKVYMEDTPLEELYCADFCHPSLCGENEECFLDTSVVCVRAPCPPPAACRPV